MLDDPIHQLRARMNNKVDENVKACVKTHLRALVNADKAFHHDVAMLTRFQYMWCEMNEKTFQASLADRPRSCRLPSFTLPFSLPLSVVCACALPDDALDACPLGGEFARRLVKYFHGLRWGPSQPPVGTLGIYIDFSFAHWDCRPGQGRPCEAKGCVSSC